MSSTLLQKYPKDFLLAKIKDGRHIKKEEIEDYYQLFHGDDEEIKYELYKLLRKKGELLDIPILSKVLDLPESTVYRIFTSDYKIAYFPVSTGELFELLVIEDKRFKEPITFNKNQEVLEALNTISRIIGKNFFVIFSNNFKHTSFMLALYAALRFDQKILNRYAFTGIVGIDRDIYDVEAIEQKKVAAQKHGKKLISPQELEEKEIEELEYWFGKNYISAPFLQLTKDKDQCYRGINSISQKIKKEEKYFSLRVLENIYDIGVEDISLFEEEDLPLDEKLWTDYINKKFGEKILNILKKAEDKTVVFHLGAEISALGFGMGVKFGNRQPAVLYHYQRGKDNDYFPVFRLDTSENLRKIKEINHNILEDSQFLQIDYLNQEKDFTETAIILYIASHNLLADVPAFLKANNINIPVIAIKLKTRQGNLPVNEDWTKYVIELNSAIGKLKEKHQINNIHLFFSIPTILSFVLGMAIGHVYNMPVYAYNKKEKNPAKKYVKVFETGNLKSQI